MVMLHAKWHRTTEKTFGGLEWSEMAMEAHIHGVCRLWDNGSPEKTKTNAEEASCKGLGGSGGILAREKVRN